MTDATAYTTKDGDMLDAICHRHYGVTAGAVERVLAANRGLADLGPIYPAGIVIALPVIPKPSKQRIDLLS